MKPCVNSMCTFWNPYLLYQCNAEILLENCETYEIAPDFEQKKDDKDEPDCVFIDRGLCPITEDEPITTETILALNVSACHVDCRADSIAEAAYAKGFKDATTARAVWRDGTQRVGTLGLPLDTAIKNMKCNPHYQPPKIKE